TAHAQHGSGDAIAVRVVADVLIGGTLGAAVGRAERKWLGLVYAPLGSCRAGRLIGFRSLQQRQPAEITVHLVGAGENERRRQRPLPQRLQQQQRATQVHIEVVQRVI